MKPDDLRLNDYIQHIFDAIALIESFTEGMTKEDFIRDIRTHQAVTLNIINLGEAATHIGDRYPDFVTQNKNIPLNQMRGMRNKLAHGYFDIDLNVLWATIKNDLPIVKTELGLSLHKQS